ncbi:hypothetical protein C6497_01715 [Candidatus Poribacteria bacterium]|nr:MAG: hypothetical protein C6497_01715 [Candidatus Poribacteria bacterium]
MRKYLWIVMIPIFGCLASLVGCTKVHKEQTSVVSNEIKSEQPDVLIYTGSTSWITYDHATEEAEQTMKLLQTNEIRVGITLSEENLKSWMSETTANGEANVCILYGVIPTTIYAAGNTQSDGSIAEKWIESTDGDTILNQADYLGYYSSDGTANNKAPLQNLMDLPKLDINVEYFEEMPMYITKHGKTLTPSLLTFRSDRPFPLEQLDGEWYPEKIFASNTGETESESADPIILRDGNRGRLAMVHQTHHKHNPKGVVAAEIIINYLLAK